VIVKPLSGAAYDRMSLRSALVIVLGGPVVGLALLPFIRGFWPLVGVTAVVSTMLGSGAITQSFLAESFPREVRGMGLGLIRTIAASLGAIGPVLFGAIADRGYFDEGYLLMSGMLIIVILFTLRIPGSTSPTESRTDS
jgi:MFS family permease